jgi:hypothetical protein
MESCNSGTKYKVPGKLEIYKGKKRLYFVRTTKEKIRKE